MPEQLGYDRFCGFQWKDARLAKEHFCGGIPAAYSALAVTREVFEKRGIDVTLPATFDPSVAPETLYDRGIAKHQELMPDGFGYHPNQGIVLHMGFVGILREHLLTEPC